jgi:hypothetical protein
MRRRDFIKGVANSGAAWPLAARFTFDLDGLPSGAHLHGATLTFTVVSPDEAIEVSADID